MLPTAIPSALGPVPVELVDAIGDDGRRGEFDEEQRIIRIRRDLCPAMLWQTLGHEAAHVALFDAAIGDYLTEKQEEAVCNAFGTFYAIQHAE